MDPQSRPRAVQQTFVRNSKRPGGRSRRFGICGGCCKPKPMTNASQVSTVSTVSKFSLSDRFFSRRSTTITNKSGVPAHIAITPRPIQSLASLSINRIGAVVLDKTGEYLAQELKIAPNRTKNIKVDSHRFYLTVYLQIHTEWHLLWNCRQVSASDSMYLHPYHIAEASLSIPEPINTRRASQWSQQSVYPASAPHRPSTRPRSNSAAFQYRNSFTPPPLNFDQYRTETAPDNRTYTCYDSQLSAPTQNHHRVSALYRQYLNASINRRSPPPYLGMSSDTLEDSDPDAPAANTKESTVGQREQPLYNLDSTFQSLSSTLPPNPVTASPSPELPDSPPPRSNPPIYATVTKPPTRSAPTIRSTYI